MSNPLEDFNGRSSLTHSQAFRYTHDGGSMELKNPLNLGISNGLEQTSENNSTFTTPAPFS